MKYLWVFCDLLLILQNVSSTFTPVYMEEENTTMVPSKFCHYEEHNNLKWPETRVGTTVTPAQLCLLENYFPLTRKCILDGALAIWENVKDECVDSKLTETTATLYLYKNESLKVINKDLSLIIEKNNLEVIDWDLVSFILLNIDPTIENEPDLINIIVVFNEITKKNTKLLEVSQNAINTTDNILYAYDKLIIDINNTFEYKTDKIITKNVEINNNYIGIYITHSSSYSPNFFSFKIGYLDETNYEKVLLMENLELAIKISELSILELLNVTITVFYNEVLFIANENRVESWIVHVKGNNEPNMNIEVVTKAKDSTNNKSPECAYWKYGLEEEIAIKGKWQKYDIPSLNNTFYKCNFSSYGYYTVISPTTPKPNSNVCLIEVTKNNNITLTWPETTIGATATPLTDGKICLQHNYEPVTRTCSVDSKGLPAWCIVNGTCSLNQSSISDTTHDLYDLINDENSTSEDLVKNLSNLITSKDDFTSFDIGIISDVLNKAVNKNDSNNNTHEFLTAINNIMTLDKIALRKSQNSLNSTDKILYSLDNILLRTKNLDQNTSNLLTRTFTICNDVVGFVLLQKDNSEIKDFSSFYIKLLHKNDKLDDFINDFSIAVIIPETIFENNNSTQCNSNNVIISIFYSDSLFRGKEDNVVGSWVLNVLITSNVDITNNPIQIISKRDDNNINTCVHWKYGLDENGKSIYGQWENNNLTNVINNFMVCEFYHLTHFTVLVSDKTFDKANSLYLEIISTIGLVLSLIGTSFIIVITICIKDFRRDEKNNLAIHISICLFLQTIFLITSSLIDDGTLCIIVGFFLHYFVIAEFCLLMLLANSSYNKLVEVFEYHNNIDLKFLLIFTYSIPLIPAITVLSLSPNNYMKNGDYSCYPKGIYLKLGVLLPLMIVLVFNCAIYITVVISLIKRNKNMINVKKLNLRKPLILLFFLLGFTWIFGIFAAFNVNIVFYYLFDITTSLHGFTVFVYYILRNKTYIKKWKKQLSDTKLFKMRKNVYQIHEFTDTTTNDSFDIKKH